MLSPEFRTTDEMRSVVKRQAAHRIGRRARQRRVLKLASVLVIVVSIAGAALYVVAPGGMNDSGRAKFNTVGASIPADGDGIANYDGSGSSGTGGGDNARGGQVAEADRQVISTGSVTVRVDDVEKAAVEAAKIATDAGGYVTKSETELDGDQEISITLRVPAEDFEKAMAQASALGEVQKRTTDAQDVTDQVVDLEGRLKTAQVTADRLRELLVDAQNLQNILTIYDRLGSLEREIEQLQGELKVVKDQVQFATVTVHLTEDDAPTVSDDLPGPLNALRSGVVAFINVVLAAVAALAFALPFLVLALAGWWLVRRWRNRGVRA